MHSAPASPAHAAEPGLLRGESLGCLPCVPDACSPTSSARTALSGPQRRMEHRRAVATTARQLSSRRRMRREPPGVWDGLWSSLREAKEFLRVVCPLWSRWALTMSHLVGMGFMAWFMTLRLFLYVCLMLPGLLRMGHFWWSSPSVLRGVRYGPNARNFLDIYLPHDLDLSDPHARRRPVVVNVMGGAWMIGFRAWNAVLGRRLGFEQGAIVFAPDYRNFPGGTLPDMLQDVRACLDWVFRNAHLYGGDLENVTVSGQSAGAQLAFLALGQKGREEVRARRLRRHVPPSPPSPPTPISEPEKLFPDEAAGESGWELADVRQFIGVSGAWDLVDLMPYMHKRGLYSHIFQAIMGSMCLFSGSPTRLVRFRGNQEVVKMLPPCHLFHGSKDKTVPIEITADFAAALAEGGAEVSFVALEGLQHAEPIIECPMRGEDPLMEMLAPLIFGPERAVNFRTEPVHNPAIIDLAVAIMPF